jgi:hypothetical protein
VRSRADAQLSALRVHRGRIVSGALPANRAADSFVWVFAGGRVLERPRAPAIVERAASALGGGRARFSDVAVTDTRLYTAPVVADGKRLGTVVAGVSLAPYEETRSTALVASLIFGGAMLGLVSLVGWWLLGASLRPVVRMTRQAAAWSDHDLGHRFALGGRRTTS